jgi:hypothetical protein
MRTNRRTTVLGVACGLAVLLLAGLLVLTSGDSSTPTVAGEERSSASVASAPGSGIDQDAGTPLAECLSSVEGWLAGEYGVRATVAEIGARVAVADPYSELPAVGRLLRLESAEILHDSGDRALSGGDISVVSLDWVELDGEPTTITNVDVSDLMVGDDVIVTARDVPDGFLADAIVSGIVTQDEGPNFHGSCTGTLSPLVEALAATREESGFEFLLAWITAKGTAEEQVFLDLESAGVPGADPDEVWRNMDPRRRSLNPGDVPMDVLETLDVRAVFVEIEGLEETGQVIFSRTESGVSTAIAASAVGNAAPVWFVEDVDATIEIAVADPQQSVDPEVLGTVEIKDLETAAGIRVAGDLDNPIVEVLDEVGLAELLGIPVEALEQLREDYLTPAVS